MHAFSMQMKISTVVVIYLCFVCTHKVGLSPFGGSLDEAITLQVTEQPNELV